jgi:predicted transcriptional regulator
MPSVIKIPEELARELDRFAEAIHKPRAAYAVEVLWRDVRRNKQREALKLSAGAWRAADHPELAQGGAAYVEQIRAEPDERFEAAIRS